MAPALRFITLALAIGLPALAQQQYVGKYDAYVGYGYLNSPKIALSQNGVHVQVGMNPRKWMALGFDYTHASGDTTLLPSMLNADVQASLGNTMKQLIQAGLVPAGYSLTAPLSSTTETFTAGPQVMIRKFQTVTFFVRPDLGAMHEKVITHPGDPIATKIIGQLVPGGKTDDWVPFIGFGGGFDIHVSRHLAIRSQADYVWDHLFSDMLPWRRTVRFSIGPAFAFGKNILE